jgi:hypothetical protein
VADHLQSTGQDRSGGRLRRSNSVCVSGLAVTSRDNSHRASTDHPSITRHIRRRHRHFLTTSGCWRVAVLNCSPHDAQRHRLFIVISFARVPTRVEPQDGHTGRVGCWGDMRTLTLENASTCRRYPPAHERRCRQSRPLRVGRHAGVRTTTRHSDGTNTTREHACSRRAARGGGNDNSDTA